MECTLGFMILTKSIGITINAWSLIILFSIIMFGRFARYVGPMGRFVTKLPPLYYVGADMEYGFYTPPNRHTADQVP